jgi:endonuclease YncB( thermonuclease family)
VAAALAQNATRAVAQPKGSMKRLMTIALCLWCLGSSLVAAPTTIDGTVVRVTDGDSLWLEPSPPGAPVQLRLQDIDAPEICQPWGAQAKRALQDLVLNKAVSVRVSGRDTHGRTLGTLYLDSLNVNKSLVQDGHAWSSRYKYDRGPYVAEERMAKALSRGFNAEAGAVMPRDFRRDHGPCHSAEAPEAAAPAAPTAASVAPKPVALPTAAAAYRCDGRTQCAQMRSCAEATYFLQHCLGVKMDGNNDGVPCERQWCKP